MAEYPTEFSRKERSTMPRKREVPPPRGPREAQPRVAIVGAGLAGCLLATLLGRRGLTRADAVAIGDGANDIPMLKAAGLGVAFRAKPAVAAVADVRIDHGDLTALLYLQGYAADEIRDA